VVAGMGGLAGEPFWCFDGASLDGRARGRLPGARRCAGRLCAPAIRCCRSELREDCLPFPGGALRREAFSRGSSYSVNQDRGPAITFIQHTKYIESR